MSEASKSAAAPRLNEVVDAPSKASATEGQPIPSKPSLAERFAEAWINRRHRVAGRLLDPFCLHHVMLLEALNNPLGAAAVGSDARISWGDLFAAVIVCTAPYEEEIQFPSVGLLWHLRVRWLTFVHWLRRRPGTALAWHCAAFRNYQNDYESAPDLFFDEQTTPLTAPGLLAKAVFLQMQLHLDERRVFTMPIGKALFSYAAAVEQLSSARLLENEESDLMEVLRKIQAGEIPIPAHFGEAESGRPALTPELFGEEASSG